MILTFAKNIGFHKTYDLTNFKLRKKGEVIDETLNSGEIWNSLLLTQIYNWDFINMLKNVLIL